jgi:hypothetical protein
MGTAPIGSLLAGWAADWIGAPNVLVVCGIVCIVGAVLFGRALPRLREQVRPIYRAIGVLPMTEEAAVAVVETAVAHPPPT